MATDHICVRGVFEALTIVLYGVEAPETMAPKKPVVAPKKKATLFVPLTLTLILSLVNGMMLIFSGWRPSTFPPSTTSCPSSISIRLLRMCQSRFAFPTSN